jgi:hypothetical protein
VSLLSAEDLHRLLLELGEGLEARGLRGDMFVVGGAAMALAYNTRRATRDLDAVFEPKQVVYDVARRVAERNGLPDDWLNDAVKGFLPGDDPEATVLFEHPGLRVRIASPRYLFAMKAAASRVARDTDDIAELFRLCGFRSVGEALDHVEATYPQLRMLPKVQFLLEELWAAGEFRSDG